MRLKINLIILIAIGLGCSAFADKTNYYSAILLVPPKTKIKQVINRALFKGYSESDIMSGFKKKYYDLRPIPIDRKDTYEKGYYKVITSSNGLSEKIIHDETSILIRLAYSIKESRKYLIRQEVFFENKRIDTVKYFYKGDDLFYTKSSLYGKKHYSKPANRFVAWWRKVF